MYECDQVPRIFQKNQKRILPISFAAKFLLSAHSVFSLCFCLVLFRSFLFACFFSFFIESFSFAFVFVSLSTLVHVAFII